MSRFFIKGNDVHSGEISITGDDAEHIRKVLRCKHGDNIVLSDGRGNEYLARIEKLEPGAVYAGIISSKKNDTEPPIDVTLFQALPKSDKMDFIIQKSTELGVKRIVPVVTARTIVKIESEKDAENKAARWQRISLEAAKQCNRGIIPHVEIPLIFTKALELLQEFDLSIMPYEKETGNSLKKCINNNKNAGKIAVIIGPEGGFTGEEIQNALLYDVKPVTLGPRILRTETAGIAVLSILMYELGDFKR